MMGEFEPPYDATVVLTVDEQPLDVIPSEVVLFEMGDKNNNGKPPPKIRGSQFVKREEKIYPKTVIRKPFIQNPFTKKLPPPQPK